MRRPGAGQHVQVEGISLGKVVVYQRLAHYCSASWKNERRILKADAMNDTIIGGLERNLHGSGIPENGGARKHALANSTPDGTHNQDSFILRVYI